MKTLICSVTTLCVCAVMAQAQSLKPSAPRFQRLLLSEQFFSEGASFADINGDGSQDVVSGPWWYAGPDFRQRYTYASSEPIAVAGYSSCFFSFTRDFNGDSHPDILVVSMPGTPAHWFENPGSGDGKWTKHLALSDVSNESPAFLDITGDGDPELVCIHQGAYGYATPDPARPTRPWAFTAVSENRGYGRFTHGMGVGDVNGDGRPDLLEKDGWWEQTEPIGEQFRFHAYPFANAGGAQMFAYDFDGDGDNDIVSSQNAHGWGLKWFEQRGAAGSIGFIPHEILPDQYDAEAPLNISQLHALALADIDGDGVKDLVTGKRFYAHGGKDPGAHQLPVLYWFRTVRTAAGVEFEPQLIDERTGVGTQLTVGDLTGNGRPDIVVGNKLGTTVVLNREGNGDRRHLSALMRRIGTQEYAEGVRSPAALTPEEEAETFVLPAGFEAQLVTSEPTIAKPMNLAFDDRDRLWITSSQEYPYAAPADRPGRDTIVILEDKDGDGHREHATTFADNLNIPIGLYPYQDGVICYSIPHIWFLRDTDGDGKADTREKLYGPMGFERDTHGMCNSFTRGFDGWLYACHGFNNHTTVAGTDGHQITMQSGNIFRMRLDGSRVEHFTHGLVNPFGMTLTPTGDHLVADCHTKPVSLLLAGGYYDSFGKPHDGLGYVPNVMSHLHGSTAIGGIAQYNDEVFPDVYHGNTFGGNVMTSRINRNSLRSVGGSLKAQEEPDLLISGDPWFRPVDLQIGPDGALYVADFYNRIIGHYEVKLDHPGRDRHRGRVWKIVYTGDDGRRDPGAVPDLPTSDSHESVEHVFAQLASRNQTRRMEATDRLVDDMSADVVPLAREGLTHESEAVRAHSMWILQRLENLTEAHLEHALSDSSELVRVHAFRVLMDRNDVPGSEQYLQAGFSDTSPLVRRVAVQAASQHLDVRLVPLLTALFHKTPANDVHLRHAIRMAIRDHLQDADMFRQVVGTLADRDVDLVAGICLALDSADAGAFLVQHIARLANTGPKTFARYVRFAARHVDVDTVDEVVKVSQQRFRDDRNLQLELLQAARQGLRQRGAENPPAIRRWAKDLVAQFLRLQDGKLPKTSGRLGWTFLPYPGATGQGNPFVLSRRRRSADGMTDTPLFSSLPRGEQRQGIYRSDPFPMQNEFSFYMAGHDGFPEDPAGEKNLVRLRDAVSHEILQSWSPPRNDTAVRFTAAGDAGRSVYVEIVDGDNASAYAWLAVGRFSVQALNPDIHYEDVQRGVALISDMKLDELRPVLVQLLRQNFDNADYASEVAAALAAMQQSPLQKALAAAMSVSGVSVVQRQQLGDAVIDENDNVGGLLGQAMRVATASEQVAVAQVLCSGARGAAELVTLCEQGLAAASLLRQPVIADSIKAVADEALQEKIDALLDELPDVDSKVEELIARRKSQYLEQPGAIASSATLFEKNCAVCHQIAGKGKKIGPNLDGIGGRGLDRLLEDVLAPSRNVDINFRSTTVVTIDGQVFTGLNKGVDGARLILVNRKGEEQSIAVDDIDEQVVSRRSPMPDNIAEVMSEAEFRNLIAWLLSQRQ